MKYNLIRGQWSRTWVYFMPPFHQGLFVSNRLNLDQIVPDQSIFDLPDGRPKSPPIAQLFFYTQLSPDYINESSRLFCQQGKAMYQ